MLEGEKGERGKAEEVGRRSNYQLITVNTLPLTLGEISPQQSDKGR